MSSTIYMVLYLQIYKHQVDLLSTKAANCCFYAYEVELLYYLYTKTGLPK